MRRLTVNKILLASCAISIPISFYVGIKIKERYQAKELDKIDKSFAPHEIKLKARIMDLQKERAELLTESGELDNKIVALRQRMEHKVV